VADAADKTNGSAGSGAAPKPDPPGYFEGESMSRRRALTVAGQAVGGLAGAVIVLPAVGFAIAPIFDSPEERWESVGPVSRFRADVYKPYSNNSYEGEAGEMLSFARDRIAYVKCALGQGDRQAGVLDRIEQADTDLDRRRERTPGHDGQGREPAPADTGTEGRVRPKNDALNASCETSGIVLPRPNS